MSTKENNKVVLGYRNKKYQRSIIETGIIIVAVLFMFLSLMIFTGGKTDDIIVGVVMLLMMCVPLVITLLIGRSKKNKLKNSSNEAIFYEDGFICADQLKKELIKINPAEITEVKASFDVDLQRSAGGSFVSKKLTTGKIIIKTKQKIYTIKNIKDVAVARENILKYKK
jgi:hypothetical protein